MSNEANIKAMSLGDLTREITRVSDIIDTTKSASLKKDLSKYRMHLFSEYRRKSHEYPSGHRDKE